MKSPRKIRFYSYLNLVQLILLLPEIKSFSQVYCFDVSRFSEFVIKAFKMAKKIKPLEFTLMEMKDENGGCYLIKCREDQLELCDIITEYVLKNNKLYKTLSKLLNSDKLGTFYSKIICNDIDQIVMYCNIVEKYLLKQDSSFKAKIELFIEQNDCTPLLKDFVAKQYGINLKPYYVIRKNEFYYTLLLVKQLYNVINAYFSLLAARMRKNKGGRPLQKGPPLIASCYTIKGLTFDFNKRCDFPWLLNSNVSHERILIYFDRQDMPVTDAMVNTLRQQNIQGIAMNKPAAGSSGIPVFTNSSRFIAIWLSLLGKVAWIFCKSFFIRKKKNLKYLPQTLCFIREYAKMYDFFNDFNIKINVNFTDHDPYRVAHHIAIKNLGGFGISYQVSNWSIPFPVVASGADIFFMFGSHYLNIFRLSGGSSKNIVICGFLSDYAFDYARRASSKIRESFLKNGVNFIASYFDENSSDHRLSTLTNKRSAYVYKKLLEWVIKDDTLGLICNPKRPNTLLQRLSEISETIKAAQATGRCIFMGGEYGTDNYPAVSVLASDVAVCLFGSGTTGLEAFLVGARVVYLDLECFYSFPEYRWGKNTIVFDNLDTLIESIEGYRSNKGVFDEFGNINNVPNIKDKDPFRDGKANVRMAEYIDCLFKKLCEGKSKEEVIHYANKVYSDKWGTSCIISEYN